MNRMKALVERVSRLCRVTETRRKVDSARSSIGRDRSGLGPRESRNYRPNAYRTSIVDLDKINGSPRHGRIISPRGRPDSGVPLQRRAEGLDDRHHAWKSVGLLEGGDHHLADGFVGEWCELSRELSMKKEIARTTGRELTAAYARQGSMNWTRIASK